MGIAYPQVARAAWNGAEGLKEEAALFRKRLLSVPRLPDGPAAAASATALTLRAKRSDIESEIEIETFEGAEIGEQENAIARLPLNWTWRFSHSRLVFAGGSTGHGSAPLPAVLDRREHDQDSIGEQVCAPAATLQLPVAPRVMKVIEAAATSRN